MIRFPMSLLTLAAVVVVAGKSVLAADTPYPIEPPDTSSPRATLASFLDGCNEIYVIIRSNEFRRRRAPEYGPIVRQALDCLDLSEQPGYMRDYVGGEAAICLKEVLDRVELPPDEEIPDAQAMKAQVAAGEPARWRVPRTPIVIARMSEGPRQGEYLFTAESVQRAAEFYEDMERLPYRTGGRPVSEGFHNWFLSEPGSPALAALIRRLPRSVETRVFGQAVWQWVGLVVTVLVGALAMFMAYRIGRSRAARIREQSVLRYCVTLLFPVAAMMVPLIVRHILADQLMISGTMLVVSKLAANLIFLFAVLVVITGAGSRIAEIIIASPRIHPRGLDAQLIRVVCRVLGLTAAVIVFLEGGRYLGIPLTTLLAGAGVGGLAVALAAQDTLKSLFGSMMILLDRPYRVGERIVIRNYDGVVEDIGLRSTKIRLLTGHLAAVPNEEMARCDVENIGRRPHIRRIEDIAIPFDTPPEKVEKALQIIRDLLADHEGMEADFPPRVYFNAYNRDSLNLRMIYWYHPPNYWDFLAFSEKVNLGIMRQFGAEGIRFALPSTAAHLTADADRPLRFATMGEGRADGPPADASESPDRDAGA